MTTAVQHRRGTTAEHAAFTGLEGEVTIDTTKDTAVIHDGTLAGGYPLAKENLANVTTSGLSSIDGASTASDDKFFIFDQSATSLKTITRAELNNAIEQDALANVAITGGTINGTAIGGTTPAAGAFTTLSASGAATLSGLTASTALALDGSKNIVSVTNTGTGSNVLATSPTLVTPALGTPSALVGTNITGTATSFNINGTVGATTPAAGAFTTLSASSTVSGTGFSTYLASPPAIGGTAAAAVSATTLSASSTVTLSGGTANGVAYLNGSKVLTSGSALTFDGTNFAVGTSSPVANTPLTLQASSGYTDILWLKSVGTNIDTRINIAPTGTGVAQVNNTNGTPIAFQISGTEQMRLTSTGLGIGTSSPSAKLGVAGNVFISGATPYIAFDTTQSGSTPAFIQYASSALVFGTGSAEKLRLDSSGNLGLGVTPSAWYSSYGTKAFQFAASGSVHGLDVSSSDRRVALANNNFINTSGADTYINTGHATKFQQVAGAFQFYTAASGTAGNAITFTQAMTLDASGNLMVGATSNSGERLRVATTGNTYLSIIAGSTSVSQLWFGDADSNVGYIGYDHSGDFMNFRTSGSERARIDSSGNLLVGTTSAGDSKVVFSFPGTVVGLTLQDSVDNSNAYFQAFRNSGGTIIGSVTRVTTTNAVVYNTTSDYRLKTVTGAVSGQGARIDALKPIDYQWKEGGQQARGFLAHEFQAVYPNSVTGDKDAVDAAGNPVYQAMQASTAEVIADLVAEIQSLRKRLADAGIA